MNYDTNTILILIGIITIVVCFIVTWIRQKHLHRTIDQFSLLMYQIHREYFQICDQVYDIDQHTKQLHKSFESFSMGYKHNQTEKHAPTPEQATKIEATIKDLVSIEFILSTAMKISRRDSVYKIIMNTIETYPDINIEYIIKKTLSVVESFIRNAS